MSESDKKIHDNDTARLSELIAKVKPVDAFFCEADVQSLKNRLTEAAKATPEAVRQFLAENVSGVPTDGLSSETLRPSIDKFVQDRLSRCSSK